MTDLFSYQASNRLEVAWRRHDEQAGAFRLGGPQLAEEPLLHLLGVTEAICALILDHQYPAVLEPAYEIWVEAVARGLKPECVSRLSFRIAYPELDTILMELYHTMTGGRDAPRGQVQKGEVVNLHFVKRELYGRDIRVLIVDEADQIDAANHVLLRQLWDLVRLDGRILGLVVAGTEALKQTLSENREIDHRYGSKVDLYRLSEVQHTDVLLTHPGFERLRAVHGADSAEWTRITTGLFTRTGGLQSSLANFLTKVHGLALTFRREVDRELIQGAIDHLAGS